jgi:hypothetical protein
MKTEIFFRYSLQQMIFPNMSEETMATIAAIAFLILIVGIMAVLFANGVDEDQKVIIGLAIAIAADFILALLFFFNIFIVIGFFGLLIGSFALEQNWWTIKKKIRKWWMTQTGGTYQQTEGTYQK